MVDFSLARKILLKYRDSIISDLQTCETYNTALDEVERSVFFLETIESQLESYQGISVSCTCVFLPLNQPLYSFFLQVFSVARISESVIFRPPEAFRAIYDGIYRRFRPSYDNIEIFLGTRNEFLNQHVNNAEIINFTGKYENALSIVSRLTPNQFMIFNGSALNPMVIDSDADFLSSAKAVLEACLYNSGQDCMAPGMIFIQESISDVFLTCLKDLAELVCVGEYSDPKVSIGPLISKEAYNDAVTFINVNREKIVYGGKYNEERRLIEPTIFLYDDCTNIYNSLFYAPLIIIYRFGDICEVINSLKTPYSQNYKGYISYFGNINASIIQENKDLPLLLYNTTLIDYESSIKEFGGYGEGCSFIYYNNRIIAKPILLLRDIYKWKTGSFGEEIKWQK